MSEPHQIDSHISVMGQVTQADVAALKEQGFSTIINNRVAGEEPGMPMPDEVAAWAETAGMAYYHVPVSMGQLTLDRVEQMKAILGAADGPVLAFCKSGMRSAAIWSLTAALEASAEPDALIAKAAAVGFDLTPLTGVIHQLNRQTREGT